MQAYYFHQLITSFWHQGRVFVTPNNPGVYPAGTTTANRAWAWLEAEHEEEVKKYQTYIGVGMGLNNPLSKK
jgi:hypothetical protein